MNEPNFKTSCRNCKYSEYCNFDKTTKMIAKKCYIHFIPDKLKITPEKFLKRCDIFSQKYGIDFYGVKFIDKTKWINMSNRDRLSYAEDYLQWFIRNDSENYATNDGKLFVAVANTYLNAWRDSEYIQCAKCGAIIKNSQQRNRKYCDECKNTYESKSEIKKQCKDCGKIFYSSHNREYRCLYCQEKANKAYTKERVRKYRQRKCNDLDSKS